MTEITCGKCSAPNPVQSKFCNRCGAPLGSETTQLCPTCNTPNPTNLLYCDNCGTRLVDDSDSQDEPQSDANAIPGGRSEPFSLPARPPGQTGNLDVSGELPDWLVTGDFEEDNLRDELDSDELRWLRAAQEGESWDDDNAPTLEELSGGHAPKDDLPTWLMDDDTGETIFAGDKSTDELFLESLGSPDNKAKEESSQESEAIGDLESWLAEMEAEEAGQTPSTADEPDRSSEQEEMPSEPAPTPGVEVGQVAEDEDNFLQWLSEVENLERDTAGGFEARSSETAPKADEVPAWLDEAAQNALETQSEPTAEEPDEFEVPDWLTDDHGKAGQPLERDDAQPEATAAEDARGEALPEDEFLQWLDSLDEDQAGTTTEQEPDPDSDLVAAHIVVSEVDDVEFDAADFALPDWLGELSEPEPDTAQELSNVEELPSWLQNLASPGEDVTLPYVSGSAAELEPEALLEDDRDQGESAAESEASATPDDAELLESELPDWLSGVTPELGSTGAPAEVQPDDAALGADAPVADKSAWEQVSDRDRVELGDQPVSAEDLPDWFSDVLDDIETLEDSLESSEDEPALPNVPEQLAGSELPDWLDSPFSDEPAAEPTPMEEIPVWLRAPLREQLARAAEKRGIGDAALESGDEWRELLEPTPSAEEATSDETGRLNASAWLESLRAGAPADNIVESESDVDEGLSPVAGIPGAIDVAYNFIQPSRRRRQTEDAPSTEQEQQVLLLRQLSRAQDAETSVTMASASTMGALPLLSRLVVSVILLGIVILGLSGNPIVSEVMPEIIVESSAPLEAFIGEAAGEPVLLIFDYTPAMSGALHPVATHVMQHLEKQESRPLIASQSAAGLALAANAGSSGTVGDLGLITGGPLGIRQIGRCMLDAAPCQSLFGQPLSAEEAGQLANTSRVVLITGDREQLVAWIEQLEPAPMQSLSAVITPALEPVAAPYLASGQLVDVAVAHGAAGVSEAPLKQNMYTAQVLSTWFAVFAIVAGSFFYLISSTIRSRRK